MQYVACFQKLLEGLRQVLPKDPTTTLVHPTYMFDTVNGTIMCTWERALESKESTRIDISAKSYKYRATQVKSLHFLHACARNRWATSIYSVNLWKPNGRWHQGCTWRVAEIRNRSWMTWFVLTSCSSCVFFLSAANSRIVDVKQQQWILCWSPPWEASPPTVCVLEFFKDSWR